MPEIGQTLSHFKIVEKIGEGGMGTVYLAEDLTLDRKVALKFLPEAFTSDPERMARFEREAKLLASLNHPNIAGIYGLEQADGNRFLVLEYVEGETLQARLSKGALPLEDALALCRQVAEGLEGAHEKGVIHRDLKPANVMITAEEKVKILDFGLAKAFANEQSDLNLSNSPTLSLAATQQGIIIGTAGYMSPEQARGKSVDRRADIWAFGVILYEMLTGSQLFRGETVSDTMASVLTQEPDFDKVPIKVRPLLKRCLTKDPKLRLRDIGDTMSLLEFTPEIVSTSPSTKTNRIAWGVAILAVLIASVSIIIVFLEKPQEYTKSRHYRIDYPDNVSPGPVGSFALSPDGLQLAFIGVDSDKTMLWLQRLDSDDEAQSLPGTEIKGNGGTIFWSPDSRFIAFDAGEELKKFDVDSGSVRKICDTSGAIIGGSWNRNDVILFGYYSNNSIMRVSANPAGKLELVIAPDNSESGLCFPQFLPDGNQFLYFCEASDPEIKGIYIGNLEAKPDEQIRKKVFSTSYSFLYAPSRKSDLGYLLTMEENEIEARLFNHKNLEVADSFSLLAQGVGNYFFYSYFSVSNDGDLIYREDLQKQFQWLGRDDGAVIETIGEPGHYETFDLSKDGKELVVSKIEYGRLTKLWKFDMLSKGASIPLTFDNVKDGDPRWPHNRDFIIFSSDRAGARNPFRINLPSGDPELVHNFEGEPFALDDISPYDKYILYHDYRAKKLMALPLDGDNEPELVFGAKTGSIDQAQFSPDGHWVAFNSTESGHYVVKVVPFPRTGEEYTISAGVQPTWKDDGSELYFISPDDGMLMAVDIIPADTFKCVNIRPLFSSKLSASDHLEEYAPDPSGEKFLVLRTFEEDKNALFKVISSWPSLLKQ